MVVLHGVKKLLSLEGEVHSPARMLQANERCVLFVGDEALADLEKEPVGKDAGGQFGEKGGHVDIWTEDSLEFENGTRELCLAQIGPNDIDGGGR